MATQTTYRLGDILISKGLITAEQLNIAISEQQKRRQQLDPASQASAAPLGEILIELGFIDRMQLKRGLGWQSVVRKVTLAMSLCAPLLTISYEAAAATAVPIVSSSSSSKSGNSLPFTIQAENYSGMSGVFNEPTTDVDGGENTGNINTNDWMVYNNVPVNIPTTGSYKITYRVASLAGGGTLSLREAGTNTSYDSVAVPSTGGWQNWTTITRTVTLPAGVHNFGITAVAGGFNINWFKIESVAASSPSSSSAAAPVAFSQTIEAENYTTMSGVYNEPTTDTGGGQNTGNINTNDWMSYSGTSVKIPVTGSYKISYRLASLSGGGSFSLVESATGALIDTVVVPTTGGWQNWVTVERTVTLTAGTHNFDIKATSGGFNVNWFKIANATAVASSSAASVLSSSSVKSSVASSSSVKSSVASSSSSKAATSSVAPVVSSSSKPAVASSSAAPIASSSSKAASVASSSSSTASGLAQTIQAEDYTSMSGVFNEETADEGGGQNTGNINANDWMSYSGTKVNVPVTGTYKVSYRVASLAGGGSFSLLESGGASYDTVTVPTTGGWQNWVTVERTITLTAGAHAFDIKAITGGFNVNWFKIESVVAPVNVTIQAEKYSGMSGVYNEPTTDVGGGENTGNIDAGDWLVYAGTSVNVPVTGNYTVTYRVASLNGGGSFSLLEAGGTTAIDTVTVPYTGGWQNWTSITRTITLTAGVHNFGITAITGGFNLNWFSISNTGSSGGVSSSSSSSTPTVVASSSSSKAAVSSSSSSKASIASSSSSSPSTTTSGGVVTTKVAGPVAMSWTAPNLRQNGSVLDITEIAGYEIRYKLATDANFTYISVNDAWTNTYNFAWMEGNYIFQIAAFDKDGLYSDFVDVISR